MRFRGVEIGSVANVLLSWAGWAPAINRAPTCAYRWLSSWIRAKILARGAELDGRPSRFRPQFVWASGRLKTEETCSQTAIDLDMHPNTPVKCYGTILYRNSTIPTAMEQAQTRSSDYGGDRESTSRPWDLVTTASESINGWSVEIRKALASAQSGGAEPQRHRGSIKHTSDGLGDQIKPSVEDLRQTPAVARAALRDAGDSGRSRNHAWAGSPVNYELMQTWSRLRTRPARRQLSDYGRNPSSVLGRYVKEDSK